MGHRSEGRRRSKKSEQQQSQKPPHNCCVLEVDGSLNDAQGIVYCFVKGVCDMF